MTTRRHRRGFTLMEVIVAVAIVAIMAGAVAPVVFKQINNARSAATLDELSSLETALVDFYDDTGRFPSEAEGLAALVVDPGLAGWEGPYLQTPSGNPADMVASDAFGRPYIYDLAPATTPAGAADLLVASVGANLGPDGGNLNANWDLNDLQDDLLALVNAAQVDRANRGEVAGELEALAAACRDYFRENAAFPGALADLDGDYLDQGFSGDAFRDAWGTDYALYQFAGLPVVLRVSSLGPDRTDDNGGDDDLVVLISSAPPGREKTETELAVAQAALDANTALVLTGAWGTDRAALGLGAGFDLDGWGLGYGVNAVSRYVYSAGPDGNAATTTDNIPTGFGP
ncbi:MAG: prepilin-type N-terminal cleavage/methylation domain-containing protein [bacterium]|nr:prepilin-type N-terminal cleavage/methylation domain-containing protein [bacterium]